MKKREIRLVTLVIGLILCMTFSTALHCYADGTVINGCYQKVDGQLRTVSNPSECRPSEVPISWDMIGGSHYAKVAVVAQSGGDYTDPIAAMNDIATWCGAPSATNPCLLKIMPGVYNIGGNNLWMQPYVDIEGSGENTTEITGNVNGYGVVNGASNAGIRSLTIGGPMWNGNASPKITNVTITGEIKNAYLSSPILNYVTINGGIYNWSGSPKITNVTVNGEIYNSQDQYGAASPVIRNSVINGPVINQANYSGLVIIEGSTITTDTNTNTIFGNSGSIYVANTRLNGGPIVFYFETNGAVLKCIGVYNNNFDPISCPTAPW